MSTLWFLCVFLLCALPCNSFFLSELWTSTDENGQNNDRSRELGTQPERNSTRANNAKSPELRTQTEQIAPRGNDSTSPDELRTQTQQNVPRDNDSTSPELRTQTEQNAPRGNDSTSPELRTQTEQNAPRGKDSTRPELGALTEQNSKRANGSSDLAKNADNVTTVEYESTKQSAPNLNVTLTETANTISTNTEAPDPEVKRKAEEQMHVEYIKRHLMSKLRLSTPPVSDAQSSALPLSELGRDYLQTQRDQGAKKYKPHQFYAKTLQIYVLGKDETENCSYRKSTGCYYFDVNGKVSPEEVQRAELWIYKLFYHRDPVVQTFIVSELGRSNRAERRVRPRNIIQRFEAKIKHGWLKIDVTETVVRWLQKPNRNDGISILCKGCQRKNHRTIFSSKHGSMPFLALETRKRHRSRRDKRSAPVQCSTGYEGCCLAPLEINFDDIGWTGIIAPKKLNYAYCRGSCNDEIDAHSDHSRIVQNYRYSNVATAKEMREMTPCCSPISFSSQSMLIRVNSTIIHENVPNLIPTACGCL